MSQPNIASIDVRAVVAPLNLPLHTASGSVEQAALILIDVRSSDGVVGRSYLNALGARHIKPIVAIVEDMRDAIIGDPMVPFEIEKKLRARYKLLGVHNIILFAMSGIDMAVWDANAITAGQPLARFLGGQVQPVATYNSKGLGIMPIKDLPAAAKALVDEGFSAVKLRLGRPDGADDVAALEAVKDSVGDGVQVMCDFNQGLDVAEALRRGRMLDDAGGLTWIEEPIRADDFVGTARLRDSLSTPISIGENFMGPEQMAVALTHECCDFVMPDVQRIGGVSGWLRAAAQAEAAALPMSSHLFPEFSCHLMTVTPTAHWLEYVDWADAILQEPLQVLDGYAQTPTRPGAGISWDESAVSRYKVAV